MNLSRRLAFFTLSGGPLPGLRCFCLGLALAVAPGAMPAGASPLSSPSTSVFCSVEGNSFFQATDCEFGGSPAIPSSALASVTLAPVPHVLATATTPATGSLGAGASATALYFFEVTGPTEGELVPILMDIYLLTESSFEANAIARIIINTTSGIFQGIEACSNGTCDETTISETIPFRVRAGSTRDSITLFAQAQAFVTRFGTETALAVADPYIYVDPTFPNAHLYNVVVSPGVGNAPATSSPSSVPEPTTLWLVGTGLGLIRCRRRWPS